MKEVSVGSGAQTLASSCSSSPAAVTVKLMTVSLITVSGARCGLGSRVVR